MKLGHSGSSGGSGVKLGHSGSSGGNGVNQICDEHPLTPEAAAARFASFIPNSLPIPDKTKSAIEELLRPEAQPLTIPPKSDDQTHRTGTDTAAHIDTDTAASTGSADFSEQSYLVLPSCAVSVATHRLVAQMHELMEEACGLFENSSGDAQQPRETARERRESGDELLLFVRELSILFFVQRPIALQKQLTENYKISAIFSNDCLYMAHHLSAMRRIYTARLHRSLSLAATFSDLVGLLRALRRCIFTTMMQKQREVLLGGIRSIGQNFQRLNDEHHYTVAETTLQGAVQHLRELIMSWRGVLPTITFVQSIALLIDAFIRCFLDQVLSMRHLSPTAATSLSHMISSLNTQIRVLFTIISSPNDADHVNSSSLGGKVEQCVSSWECFCLLCRLLNADFSAYIAQKSRLRSYFSSDQLRNLLFLNSSSLGCPPKDAYKRLMTAF